MGAPGDLRLSNNEVLISRSKNDENATSNEVFSAASSIINGRLYKLENSNSFWLSLPDHLNDNLEFNLNDSSDVADKILNKAVSDYTYISSHQSYLSDRDENGSMAKDDYLNSNFDDMMLPPLEDMEIEENEWFDEGSTSNLKGLIFDSDSFLESSVLENFDDLDSFSAINLDLLIESQLKKDLSSNNTAFIDIEGKCFLVPEPTKRDSSRSLSHQMIRYVVYDDENKKARVLANNDEEAKKINKNKLTFVKNGEKFDVVALFYEGKFSKKIQEEIGKFVKAYAKNYNSLDKKTSNSKIKDEEIIFPLDEMSNGQNNKPQNIKKSLFHFFPLVNLSASSIKQTTQRLKKIFDQKRAALKHKTEQKKETQLSTIDKIHEENVNKSIEQTEIKGKK